MSVLGTIPSNRERVCMGRKGTVRACLSGLGRFHHIGCKSWNLSQRLLLSYGCTPPTVLLFQANFLNKNTVFLFFKKSTISFSLLHNNDMTVKKYKSPDVAFLSFVRLEPDRLKNIHNMKQLRFKKKEKTFQQHTKSKMTISRISWVSSLSGASKL